MIWHGVAFRLAGAPYLDPVVELYLQTWADSAS